MNISFLEIERFGIWAGLTVPKLSSGLNVFYGGNEAGKSTLMEFIRSQLYGFGEHRKRFARRPGGKHTEWNADYDADGKPMLVVSGGILQLECPSGSYTLRRTFHPDGIEGREEIDLRSLDGSQEKAQLLRILTCGVDETTFNNVFAIGLDELQRLGSLNDTEASEMLFRLSTGLDRISIVDSIKEITARRNAVLNIHEQQHKPSLLTQLLRQRDKIIEEQSDVKLQVREYVRLRSERKDIDHSLGVLENELNKLHREKRLYETAEISEPIWIRRSKVRQEIAVLGNAAEISELTIKQLDEINDRRSKKRLAYSELKAEYLRAVDAVKQLPVNETLLQFTPKIEALFDEEKRIIEIDGLITEHEKEISLLENRISEAENQIKRGRRALLLPAAKRSIFPETFYSAQKVAVNAAVNSADNSAAQSQDRTTFTQSSAELSAVSRTENTAASEQIIPATAKGSRPFLESNELIDVSFLDSYKVPSTAARKAKKRLVKARRRLTELSGQNKVLETRIETELNRRNAEDINTAFERTTETVQFLRRSQGIAVRLAELTAQFKDLHRINNFLMQNQSLPIWLTVLIGLISAIGAVPLGILLFEQSGAKVFDNNMPIPWVLLGLAAIGASVGFKILTERSYSRKLEENQRQLGMISTQIEQVKQESASVNARLAALQGSSAAASLGKSPEVRLQEAQQELLQLEKLQPLETEHRQVAEELKKVQQRYEHYKHAAVNASKRWNDWLKNAGLPESWSPAKLRELLAQCNAASDMKKELDLRYEAMNQRIRDMKTLTERIDRIVLESGLSFEDGVSYVDILAQLRTRLAENEIILNKRNKLRSRLPEFRKMRKKVSSDLRKIHREEDNILRPFGVKTAEELRTLYKKTQKHRQLLQQEQGIQRELDAAAGTFCTESEIADLLLPRIHNSHTDNSPLQDESEAEKLPSLKTLLTKVSARIESLSVKQREELEERGKLTEQLQKIADDKTALEKQRELSVVEEKIRQAQQEWQTYAVCGKMLDTIRSTYEKERQPRTLAEASEFLRKLTDGKYRRIWSPLSEETLLVDDESGNTFDAAWLSRGTRELMFIAIRLALASAFAQHGSILPLVMDDVLVDFDSKRSLAAAKVLLDFAQSGRQILLLTCREDVCRIFQKLDVPVRILPPVDEPSRGMKVLLPKSILEKRETERRKKISAIAAERNRQIVEEELSKREDKIRLETLRKAEVQRLIVQMQQQATAEKIVDAAGKQL